MSDGRHDSFPNLGGGGIRYAAQARAVKGMPPGWHIHQVNDPLGGLLKKCIVGWNLTNITSIISVVSH